MKTKEKSFLEVAKKAAINAGKIIMKYYGKNNEKFLKDDVSDFATQADLESEKLIISIILENFPDHNIIAEEGGKHHQNSEYTWVIDPLDGTVTFAAGLPFFAVSIGLLKNGELILSVLNQVAAKQIYWAQKGQGAYLNGKRMHVSKTADLAKAAIGVDFGHKVRRQEKVEKYVTPLINKVSYPYSLGSDALLLALVAQGVLDLVATSAWIWDFAGGVLLIKEAGGMVTDANGKELNWTKDRLEIVASNGLIHDQIIKTLKQ